MPSADVMPTPAAPHRAEAAALLALYQGNAAAAVHHVVGQFAVIQSRAQLLLTLSTLTLTITGFSGPNIAASNMLSRWMLAIGLVMVLSGVLLLLRGLDVNWLSRRLPGVEPVEALAEAIAYRDRKTDRLRLQLLLIGSGLAAYVGAVVAYLAVHR